MKNFLFPEAATGCIHKIFAKITRKHLCQSLFFNKVAGLLWHRYFPVIFFFWNFSEHLFHRQNTYGDCFSIWFQQFLCSAPSYHLLLLIPCYCYFSYFKFFEKVVKIVSDYICSMIWSFGVLYVHNITQKIKFFMKGFFSKCDQTRGKLTIYPGLKENYIQAWLSCLNKVVTYLYCHIKKL